MYKILTKNTGKLHGKREDNELPCHWLIIRHMINLIYAKIENESQRGQTAFLQEESLRF